MFYLRGYLAKADIWGGMSSSLRPAYGEQPRNRVKGPEGAGPAGGPGLTASSDPIRLVTTNHKRASFPPLVVEGLNERRRLRAVRARRITGRQKAYPGILGCMYFGPEMGSGITPL
jgi:hypothetical protein